MPAFPEKSHDGDEQGQDFLSHNARRSMTRAPTSRDVVGDVLNKARARTKDRADTIPEDGAGVAQTELTSVANDLLHQDTEDRMTEASRLPDELVLANRASAASSVVL